MTGKRPSLSFTRRSDNSPSIWIGLKKSADSWACRSTTSVDRDGGGTKHPSTVRTAGDQSNRLLLPTVSGNRREPGADEAAGRVAHGESGLWEPASDGDAASRRAGGGLHARESA